MFVVTGIEKGFNNEDFLEEIEKLNYEIVNELGQTVKDKIKVITKKQCRNQSKENWILQAEPAISKWFLKKGIINFDLVKVHVMEHLNLAMCFKCSGFGHVAKHCSEEKCCLNCGGEHEARNCKSTTLNCPNCEKMKIEDRNHSAKNLECPVYKRRMLRYKNNINYGSNPF